jgi:hypothetical protein
MGKWDGETQNHLQIIIQYQIMTIYLRFTTIKVEGCQLVHW